MQRGEAVQEKTRNTAEDFRSAAEQICRALQHGQYKKLDGTSGHVNGDVSKLAYVASLSPLARDMMKRFNLTCREIPGTVETRKLMRHHLVAYQIVYGLPIMVTWSPSERASVFVLRFHRTMESDPMRAAEVPGSAAFNKFGGRDVPLLEGEVGTYHEIEIDMDRMLSEDLFPNFQDRKRIAARDPLACLYAFQTLVRLMLRNLLGVRVCAQCPRCNFGDAPCMDGFGSVAHPEGGSHGRCDAYFACVEAQGSSKSLHVHVMVFPQCIHQHSDMDRIIEEIEAKKEVLSVIYM